MPTMSRAGLKAQEARSSTGPSPGSEHTHEHERGRARFFGGKVQKRTSEGLSESLKGTADSIESSHDIQELSMIGRRATLKASALSRSLTFKSAAEDDQAGEDTGDVQAVQHQEGRRQASISMQDEQHIKSAFKSGFFAKLDEVSGLTHYLTRGHKDRVTCVCADIGADTIVTGSKDGTARVWMYEKHLGTYDLFAVLTHEQMGRSRESGKPPPTVVTAAAVIEGEGLVVTGTNTGDVFFTDLSLPEIACISGLHDGQVNEVAIRNGGMQTVAIEVSFIPEEQPSLFHHQIGIGTNHQIGVTFIPEDRGFLVEEVLEEGIIQHWNTEHPNQAIKTNDIFTSINGFDLRIDTERVKTADEVMRQELLGNKAEIHGWRHTEGTVFVASCGGHNAKLLTVHDVSRSRASQSEASYTYREVSTMAHDHIVTHVRFVSDGSPPHKGEWGPVALYIVTASEDGAHTWNMFGVKTATFQHPGRTEGMSIPLRDECMLVTAGGGTLCVWDLQASKIPDEKLASNTTMTITKPKAQHKHEQSNIDVNLRGRWVVESNKERCVMWSLMPKDTQVKQIGTDLEQRLLPEKKHIIVNQFFHKSPVSTLRIVEDPNDGGVLVCGCEDGRVLVWDMEGDDCGEVIARVRSLEVLEFFSHFITNFISFVQLSSFAFGPAIAWPFAVKHTAGTLTPLARLNLVLLLGGNAETKLWVGTWSVLFLMVVVVVLVLGDVHAKVTQRLNLIMSSDQYHKDSKKTSVQEGVQEGVQSTDQKKKKKHKKTSRKRSLQNRLPAGRSRLKAKFYTGCVSFITLLFFGCCTFLVVPFGLTLAQSISCEDSGGRLVVIIAPKLECFVGAHLHLCVAIAMVAPIYYFLLFPYALVRGDAGYVQRKELLCIKAWEFNAKRRGTQMHLGPMHPIADNIFVNVCSEIACKITLPVIAKLTITSPALQMTLIVPFGFFLCAITYRYKPLVEGFWNIILLGSRAWTCCAMVCALLVTLMPGRIEPVLCLAAASAVVPFVTYRQARGMDKVMDHKQVLRLRVQGAKMMSQDAGP